MDVTMDEGAASRRRAPARPWTLGGKDAKPGSRCSRCGGRLPAATVAHGICRECRIMSEEAEPVLALAVFGPLLRRGDPAGYSALRRELAAMALELHGTTALAALETFDFGAPRVGAILTDAQREDRSEAWFLCCQAADAKDRGEAERLRCELLRQLQDWPDEVMQWFAAQFDGYVEERLGPRTQTQLELFTHDAASMLPGASVLGSGTCERG